MKRGDVVWHKFKEPDKKRPVLIITRDGAISELNDVTVIPITSKIRDLDSEVFLTMDQGMPQDCVANVDRIHTVPKHKLSGFITRVTDEQLDEVFTAMKFAFGFEDE